MNHHLELAIKTALEAGKAIMEVYDSNVNIEYKIDNSPLTEADRKSNSLINSLLRPSGIPIISEENTQIDYEVRRAWNICWVVDPLDGTKEFIKKNGEFAVNIALIEKNKPVLGVIYVPAKKEIYYADVSKRESYSARLMHHNTSISRIKTISIPLQPYHGRSKPSKVIVSRSHINKKTIDYIEYLKTENEHLEFISMGSSIKFCLIANGEAQFYPRFSPTMEWDTAAGHALCKAIGFEVLSIESKMPLIYNKPNLTNPNFFVSNNRNFI